MSFETFLFTGFQDTVSHSCSVHFSIREYYSIVFSRIVPKHQNNENKSKGLRDGSNFRGHWGH